MDRSVAAEQQVPNVDILRGDVPSSPEGATISRQEIVEDDLNLFMDAHRIRDVYQAWLVGEDNVDLLREHLGPWLRGDVEVTISPVEGTNIPQILLEVERTGLVQLPRFEDNLVDLQDLAPVTKGIGAYREAVGITWPGFLTAKIRLKITYPPYSCTFEENRAASTYGDVVHPCVEINGQQYCGAPEGSGARFSSEGLKGLETCIQAR